MRATRLLDEPIIHPGSHPSVGHNIQGPSLIRVPEWVEDPLGTYYLYFADHKGKYIRLAYADDLTGPWTVHPPGALHLDQSGFPVEDIELDDATFEHIEQRYREAIGDAMPEDIRVDLVATHVASPDVHVDHDAGRIVMYFHGLVELADQRTRVATSADGISFEAHPELLGPSYFRVFEYDGFHYALVMPGTIMRSRDGYHDFEAGPTLFEPNMRHSAVRVLGDELEVFWSRVGDAPERILRSTMDLRPEWLEWAESEPIEILRPEHTWEGAGHPVLPSVRGAVNTPVNQLRDPALFEEDGVTYLLYSVAGESGIAIARLDS